MSSPPPTHKALDDLLKSGLVLADGEAYLFKHALVQDMAYDSMLKRRRREVHASIARALLEKPPVEAEDRPELLARHYEGAGMTEEAVAAWLRTGQRAMGRGAHNEALAAVSRGIGLLEGLPETPEHLRSELTLRSTMNGSLVATRGYTGKDFEENCLRCQELCRLLVDPPELLPVLYALWVCNLAAGRKGPTMDYAEQCIAAVAGEPDSPRKVTAHFAYACTCFYLGDLEPSWREFDLALAHWTPELHGELAGIYGDDHGLYCYSYRLWSRAMTGEGAVGRRIRQRMLDVTAAWKDGLARAMTCCFVQIHHHELGEREEMRTAAQEMLELSREQGFLLGESGACGAGVDPGETGRSRRNRGDQGRTCLLGGNRAGTSADLLGDLLADACLTLGRHDEGLEQVEVWLRKARVNADGFYEQELLRLKGELLPAKGESQARSFLMEALQLGEARGAWLHALRAANALARTAATAEESSVAREHISRILPRVDGDLAEVRVAQGYLPA